MPRWIAWVYLAVMVLAVAGCGSSTKKKSTTTPTPSPSSNASVKPRTYPVKMAGANEVPKGAPGGSATALITIKASKQLCWKFTNLHNVTTPTMAHIHQAPAGIAGMIVIPLGAKYKASGCVPNAAAGVLSQIEKKPKGFYVNIHNAKYPGGAVRAQL